MTESMKELMMMIRIGEVQKLSQKGELKPFPTSEEEENVVRSDRKHLFSYLLCMWHTLMTVRCGTTSNV